MPLHLEVTALTVRELLSVDWQYVLPSFQRAYVWGTEEVDRLLDEIEAAIERGGDAWHYLGTVILARGQAATEASIVDGQQRITTITIVLAALRDLQRTAAARDALHALVVFDGSAAMHPPGTARLQPRQTTAAFLRAHAQEAGATTRPAAGGEDGLSSSELNILRNRDLVRRRLVKLGEARRERLQRFLLEECQLAMHTVASEAEARHIFVVTQTTGIEPEDNDVLKANVIEKIDDDEEEREACAAAWDACEAELGPPRLLELLAKLRDRKLRQPHYRDNIAADIDAGLPGGAEASAFVHRELVPATRAHMAFADFDLGFGIGPVFGRINRRLQYLSWLEAYRDWQSLALHWLIDPSHEPDETLRFLVGLERLVYAQAILAIAPAERLGRYHLVMAEIDRGSALEPDGQLTLSPEAATELRDILRTASFKSRRYARSILLRLDGAATGDDAVTPPVKPTIEHILPLKPNARSGWRQAFGVQSDTVYGATKHRLANLTLLEARAAAKDPGNAAFAIKQPFYRDSSFGITRRLADEAAWTPATLGARAEWIVETLFHSWGIAG